MPIDLPLTKKRKETLFKIFLNVPKTPDNISIDDLEPQLNLSKTTIFNNLQFLIEQNAVLREKKAGGIYYYSSILDKKNLELKLENNH